jgi:tetratricopeptide (TPR) repeat protein
LADILNSFHKKRTLKMLMHFFLHVIRIFGKAHKGTHALLVLSLFWISVALAQTAPDSPNIDTLRKAASSAQFTDKKPAEAIELWSRLLQLKPYDNQALRLRGLAYAETGQPDLAERDGLRATELEPGNSSAWNSLCWGRILANRPLEARAACERGVALDVTNWAATVNLGHTFLLVGDRKRAQNWYQKTLPFIDTEGDLNDGPLADFDIFIGKGWQVSASKDARTWFETHGKGWLTKKAPADELLEQAKAAEKAKDYFKAVALR